MEDQEQPVVRIPTSASGITGPMREKPPNLDRVRAYVSQKLFTDAKEAGVKLSKRAARKVVAKAVEEFAKNHGEEIVLPLAEA